MVFGARTIAPGAPRSGGQNFNNFSPICLLACRLAGWLACLLARPNWAPKQDGLFKVILGGRPLGAARENGGARRAQVPSGRAGARARRIRRPSAGAINLNARRVVVAPAGLKHATTCHAGALIGFGLAARRQRCGQTGAPATINYAKHARQRPPPTGQRRARQTLLLCVGPAPI